MTFGAPRGQPHKLKNTRNLLWGKIPHEEQTSAETNKHHWRSEERQLCVVCLSMSNCLHVTSTPGMAQTKRRHRYAHLKVELPRFSKSASNDARWKLTRHLTHAPIVLAAVSGFLTVGIAVARRLPLAVFEAFVVPAGAAVGALSFPAAGLGPRDQKREISPNDEPTETRRAPSTRSHDGEVAPVVLHLLTRTHATAGTHAHTHSPLDAELRGKDPVDPNPR